MRIELRGVTIRCGSATTLQAVTAAANAGDCIVLAGPNGAGKSTLLRILAAVHPPDAGEVRVSEGEGTAASANGWVGSGARTAAPDSRFAKVGSQPVQAGGGTPSGADYRDQVGYLPQRPRFYDHLTPVEWLQYLARLKAIPPCLVRDRIAELASELGWQEAARTRLGSLSLGMRQRVALASAYLNDPDLVLLDEPLTNLDPEARLSILDWMATQIPGRITIIATHTLAELEHLANRLWLLAAGELVADLSTRQALEQVTGRVWQVNQPADERAPAWGRVVGCRRLGATSEWRVLAEAAPWGAQPAEPTLDDAYVALMGGRAVEDFRPFGVVSCVL